MLPDVLGTLNGVSAEVLAPLFLYGTLCLVNPGNG